MTFSVVIERISDLKFPQGYYYAHIPSLDLTTHGKGIEGAKIAAKDLIQCWISEKIANGEEVPFEEESFFSRIELEDAVQSA